MIGEEPDWDTQETTMLITLDNLAHRYQCLPSQALEQGTTFDLRVLEVATRWHNRQQQQADSGQVARTSPRLSESEMQAMLARTRAHT